jgi:sialic acid synthase
MILKIGKKKFNLKDRAFVIAEIGHNHKGSLEIAKELIKAAKDSGADAVKFQKRNNKELYTEEMFNQPYDHPNSYGATYGIHREALEFNKKQYLALKKYAEKLKIIFFATPFDLSSVDFLESVGVPCYKMASADLTNTPLQKYVAKTKKLIFLSTGGGNFEDIVRAYKNIKKYNNNLAILHCTASYPADVSDMNLNIIKKLKKTFPKNIIGLSDHENGIDAAPLAYMLGARIFEKHFTLNRSWKGTDQSFSLEPQGLKRLVRNLKRIPHILGSNKKKILRSEKEPIRKMAKSIVSLNSLKKGHIIKYKDLAFKSPGGGLKPYELNIILNKKLKVDVQKDEQLLPNKVK